MSVAAGGSENYAVTLAAKLAVMIIINNYSFYEKTLEAGFADFTFQKTKPVPLRHRDYSKFLSKIFDQNFKTKKKVIIIVLLLIFIQIFFVD